MEPQEQVSGERTRWGVSIPYGKWNQISPSLDINWRKDSFNTLWEMEPRKETLMKCVLLFQYPMGNGTILFLVVFFGAVLGFNTLWEMEPSLRGSTIYAGLVSIPYGKWNRTQLVRLCGRWDVSIPYGKWNQQQSVATIIIAPNGLYVKVFSKKFFYWKIS